MLISNLYGGYFIYPDIEIDPYEVKEIDLNKLSNKTIISLYKLYLAHKIIVDTVVELRDKYAEATLRESGEGDLSAYALKQEVAVKVDKELGKSLSTNDFLNKYKAQLDNLNTDMSTNINQAISHLVDGAPATLDTLKEIADWIELDGVTATDLASNLAGKSNKAHTHEISEVVNLPAVLESKLEKTANAVSATKLATIRTITFTGGVTGTYSFDGTTNLSVPLTVDFSSCLKTNDSRIAGWNTASTNSHTHTNKAILDATTASYIVADKTKLDSLVQFNAVKLTQVEYDALTVEQKNSSTVIYIIIG